MLLRPSTIRPSNEVNFKNDPECQEKAMSPFHPDTQFTFSSSTPLHSHTLTTFCTPTRFQEPITIGTDSPVCLRLHFTPESTSSGSTNSETGYNHAAERGRNRFTSDQASRSLLHSDGSSLSNGNHPETGPASLGSLKSSDSVPLLDPLTKDSPSSGFASMTSSDSNPNSFASSDSREPLMCVESEASTSSVAENKEIATGPPDYEEFLESESNSSSLDFDGCTDEELIGPLHWNRERSLIGDFTKPYALPLVRSHHPDLKGISPNTVREVTVVDSSIVTSIL